MFLIIVYFCVSNFIDNYAVQAAFENNSSASEEPSFKTEITAICDEGAEKLVITGDTIQFSELLKPDGTFKVDCGNSTNLTVAYIFAFRKIVIDQNVYAPGFDLFILAPTWQVVSITVIYLNGVDGEAMPTPETSPLGKNGVNGRAGNPGQPGGHFYGVGETFIDAKYLTINVSGGNGGPGQDGGVGGPGSEGRHALKSNLSLTCSHSACDVTGTTKITAVDNKGEYTEFNCKEEFNYIIYDMFFLPPVSGNVRECSYYIYGSAGSVAGAGGDGGVGGKGGNPGEILLTELSGRSEIVKVNNTGSSGMNGRGNQGGAWTYTGWDVSFKKRETYSNESPHISGTTTVKYIDSRRFVRLEKTLGNDGANSRNMTEPAQGKPLDLPKLYDVMSEYIKFISSHKKQ